MADTQPAPAESGAESAAPQIPQDGSIDSAAQAFLGMLEPQEEDTRRPEETAQADTDESVEASEPEEVEAEGEQLEAEATHDDDEDGQEYEIESDDEEPPVYAVKVDGEEIEVSLDELLKGYSRHSAFTQKTQQLADQRREFETEQQRMSQELAQIQHERQQYVDALQHVIAQTSNGLEQYTQVNWEQLKAEDPIEYVTKKEEFREHQEKLHAYQQQQAHAVQQQESDYDRARQEMLVKENEQMSQKIPEWNEPEKRADIAGKLSEYAKSQGFIDEEIRDLIDHRSLVVLKKAMEYDAIMSSDLKAKKVKGKPRVIRSGQGVARKASGQKRQRSKHATLKKSGNVRDAAAVFEEMMQ